MSFWQYKYHQVLHYLTSNSRHGTHSPFVYKLVDEVIYALPSDAEKKIWTNNFAGLTPIEIKKRLLLVRLLQDFSYSEFELCSNSEDLNLENLFEYYKNKDVKGKIFFIKDIRSMDTLLDGRGEDDIIIVDEPCQTADKLSHWRLLKSRPHMTISIDLFHYGLIFFRSGQRREHFKIRFSI